MRGGARVLPGVRCFCRTVCGESGAAGCTPGAENGTR